MKKRLSILLGAVVIGAIVFAACGTARARPFDGWANAVDSTIFVEGVDLPGDFMLGVDFSSVMALEDSGVVFRGWDGAAADLFELFAAGGANWARVRVWNDPWLDPPGATGPLGYRRGFGGGNNDVERAIEFGRRATAAGLRLLVNFHYSDFWADPGKQMAPRAWVGMSVEQKAAALYDFTYDAITRMLQAGIDIGMVQIGNETNNGIAGVTGWDNKVRLFDAGSRAVIDAEQAFRGQGTGRKILIAVHKTDPENHWVFTQAATALRDAGVVYDVFGISYYNFWHGSLENLLELMNLISGTFDVDVAVFETSYPFTAAETDGHDNTWSGDDAVLRYPISVQGQAHAIRDVAAAVAQVRDGRGVGLFLWEPAWITVGYPVDYARNRALWERHGSGWASSYAAGYDPQDAGQWHGGSSWDNQAFFDHAGNPLATLNLFNYLRTGALSRYGNRIDMIPLTEFRVNFFDDLTPAYLTGNVLPQAVPAVFANNAVATAAVTWNEADLQSALNRFRASGGITTATVAGTATGAGATMPALLRLTILPGNEVRNYGFEDPDMAMWRVTFRGDAQGYANRGDENVRSGGFGFRWWRAANQPLNFSIEQDLAGLSPGTYGFAVFITGGDAGAGYEIYVYVRVNGVEVGRVNTSLPGWTNWNNPTLSGIRVSEGDEVTIGASLFFPNTSAGGAWGTLDDFFFYMVE